MRKIHTVTTVNQEDYTFRVAVFVKNEDGTTIQMSDLLLPDRAKYTADELAMINTINAGLTAISQPELSDEEIDYHIMRGMRGIESTPEDLQKLAGFTVEKIVHTYS